MRRAAAAALAALAIAGCGGDEETEVVTPASVVPADALAYADAVLRPEGEERTAIEAPLTALLNSEDPGGLLVEELDVALAQADPPLSWAEDLEPWLGERGAAFLLEAPAEGAVVLDAADPEAAADFAAGLGDGPLAAEVVDDYLALGTEDAVAAVADTAAGGASLADDEGYEEAMGDDAGATATLFADVPALLDGAEEAGELPAGERAALDDAFAGLASAPVTAAIDAETTGFGFALTHGAGGAEASALAEPELLRELPADTWLAAGLADAGDAIGSLLEGARGLGVDAAALEEAEADLRRETGLEFEDLHSPLGDGALFASGQGIFGAGGGVVFEAADAAAAERLVGGLERAAKRGGGQVRSLTGAGGATGFSLDVPNIPGAVNFVAGSGRVVAAYGEAATVAALDPDQADGALGASERFGAAESQLGEDYEVSAYLDFDPLAGLLDLAAATDPRLAAALPYLDALDLAIAGSRADGDRVRHRAYLGVAGITEEPAA